MPEKRKAPPLLRLRLQGPVMKSGRIPVPDLIEICKHAQAAVNRQAQAMEGQRTKRPGPIISKVQNECTLELLRMAPGSTILDFGLEKPQLYLPYPDLETYGSDVISELTDTLEYFEKGGNGAREFDLGVLDSIHKLGAVFDRKRVSKIGWTMPRRGSRKSKTVTYSSDVRDTIEQRIQSLPSQRPTEIEGFLEMADFKPEDRKCRIDPLLGRPITCTFEREIGDQIYGSLRSPVRVSGVGRYHAETDELQTIHIKTITPIETVQLGAGDFEPGKSLGDLIRDQGIKPLKKIRDLAGGLPDDESLDEMIEEIYATRS